MRAANRHNPWERREAPWLKRDATLHWLALGLLLAAWNAADDAEPPRRRPQPLQAYALVTVRAMSRVAPVMKSSTKCKARYL